MDLQIVSIMFRQNMGVGRGVWGVVGLQSRKVNDTFITKASGRSQVFIHHVEQAMGE